jgi:putative ABC transport system ATP-binding protein
MHSSPLVVVSQVSKSYRLGAAPVPAVRSVSLTLEEGDLAALAGPSGSGKSTLLNLVGCLDRPDAGEIVIGDERVSHLSARALTVLRRQKLGFVFQSFNLLPVLTAAQNVEYPLLLTAQGTAERRRRVEELLDRVGLRGKAARLPNELSGGERQRVAIARALVNRPALVLADEPTASLDSATGASVLDLMDELREALDVTFLMASHDPRLLARMGRVFHMKDGALENHADAATPAAFAGEMTCA